MMSSSTQKDGEFATAVIKYKSNLFVIVDIFMSIILLSIRSMCKSPALTIMTQSNNYNIFCYLIVDCTTRPTYIVSDSMYDESERKVAFTPKENILFLIQF